jgi:3-deoxy-D-manno-octulosonic-acid transferase
MAALKLDEALVESARASAAAAWQIVRYRRAEWWPFLRERWGWHSRARIGTGPRIWIVCAPGGEVVQTAALGPALRRAFPDATLVLSTTNAPFLAVARRIGGLDRCFFTPFDRRRPVGRALAGLRPDLLVTVESAFTPVLLREAHRRGIVTMLASGTMTADYHLEPSYARALRHRVFDAIDVVGVKDASEPDAFARLGVPAPRIRLLGDLRHDGAFFRVDESERAAWRVRLGVRPGEGLLVAGSVRGGEEEPILEAYARLREKDAPLRLVIAPRFVAQTPCIEREGAARGLGVERVSAGAPRGADVIVLDTYGDLPRVYALARYVFLGGTLVRVGAGLGQNLIEPLAHGAPIFFGPHVKRWAAITAELCGIFPGLAIEGADDLVAGVLALEAAPATVAALRERAQALMARGADATARHVEAIREALAARRSIA